MLLAEDRNDAGRSEAGLDALVQARPNDPEAERRFVHRAIRAVASGRELDEATLMRVLNAVTQQEIRDSLFRTALQSRAQAAESLWLTLTQAAPSSKLADVAVLLAFSAYMRRDWELVTAALDRAQQATPGHPLARIFREAQRQGVEPERLAEIAS